VTPSSLRFLEREGLIVPTRTPGGHRLYSEADVRRILQIKEWQAQRLTLEQIHERLRQRDTLPDTATLTQTFLRQVLGGQVEEAGRTILDADDLGLPLQTLFGEVIQPALIEVGRGWQHGTVLVAQEKTVSELVRDLIAELSLRHAAPDPQGPTVVAGCVKGERHELGLRMIVGLLRAEGFRVQYLGADVDTGFLLDAVRLHPPAAVLLSARLDAHEAALIEAIAALRAAVPPDAMPVIVVGGRLASERAHHLASLGAVPITSASATTAMQTLKSIILSSTGATVIA
jgi:DNA-binding transcriptional MerR regulator